MITFLITIICLWSSFPKMIFTRNFMIINILIGNCIKTPGSLPIFIDIHINITSNYEWKNNYKSDFKKRKENN